MTVVVDTSALFSILLREPSSEACAEVLESSICVMSAGTHLEAIVVGWRKGGEQLRRQVQRLIETAAITTLEVDADMSKTAIEAFDRFGVGRGLPPAALTYGDCFAYALAKCRGWPLLFVGDDFAKTDIVSAIPAGGRS